MVGARETTNSMLKPFILAVIVGLDIYRMKERTQEKQVKVAAALLNIYTHTSTKRTLAERVARSIYR